MHRVQVDLIDMGVNVDPKTGASYIAHAKDHFTKKEWAKGLPTKACGPVAQWIRESIIVPFGPMRILQVHCRKQFNY